MTINDYKTGVRYNDITNLREFVRDKVRGKRFEHIVSMENEAVRLCGIYLDCGYEIKARAAALLHDLTKHLDKEEQIALCEEYGVELSQDDINTPKCLHAITAAEIAKREFSADADVYRAVLYHTLGDENMPLFAKLIYLADYIEETRTFADCLKLREYFYVNLNKAKTKEDRDNLLGRTILRSFDYTLTNLVEENKFIHPKMIMARNKFLN